MVTKEEIKKEIDKLTDWEVEQVYFYLDFLIKRPKKLNISALNLGDKLDKVDFRRLAYE
jgi:hypothetical protein